MDSGRLKMKCDINVWKVIVRVIGSNKKGMKMRIRTATRFGNRV